MSPSDKPTLFQPEQLTELLGLVADQSRLVEQMVRMTEIMRSMTNEFTILRSTVNNMVEDRHTHLIPLVDGVKNAMDRLRDEVKESLDRNAEACQGRRDRLDKIIDDIRIRGIRQEALVKSTGRSAAVPDPTEQPEKKDEEGLVKISWTQKVKPLTIVKWLFWAISAGGAFFGGQHLQSRPTSSPPSVSAPAPVKALPPAFPPTGLDVLRR